MSTYRQAGIEAYGDSCEICDSVGSVVIHHIDGDRTNNELGNLVPVCRSCHSKIHTGADGFEEWTERLMAGASGQVNGDNHTASPLEPEMPQPARDDPGIPWVYSRPNVKDQRDMVQYYLRRSVQEAEGQLVAAVSSDLEAGVSLTDVREAAVVAAMRDPEAVADELRRWGFEPGDG